MNRRTLLAAVGSAALAGCLTDGSLNDGSAPRTTGADDDPFEAEDDCSSDASYTRCGRLFVAFDSLPAPVQCEVEAALENGQYRTEDDLLIERAIDTDRTYVRKNDVAYQSTVTETDRGERLLEMVEPDHLTLRRVHELRVENVTDAERTLKLEIEREGDGATVVDETLALAAGDRESVPVSDVIGTYEVRATDDRGLEEAFESRLGELFQFDVLEVGDDPALIEASADVAPCSWETES
ncbi:hypothetical protein [Natronococcus wangiae]|uniref:hypothetical protein n=1 Tax=Natronococcus wangiae TaxID=3068275 RepID=UPI00273D9897|nr:hypothetical protein [Natronococcus sp. AD5]